MLKHIKHVIIASAFVGVLFLPTPTNAQATDTASLLAQLEALMGQIQELQAQLATLRGEVQEVHEELRDNLREGMTDEDIEKIQELLATDSDIYPEGLVTGYFGPLTRAALERFQARHNLRRTGAVDEETRELLEEYLREKFDDGIPPGLLRAPGIMKKVELRYRRGCDDNGRGMGLLCQRLRVKYDDDSDENEDDSDDDDSDENSDS